VKEKYFGYTGRTIEVDLSGRTVQIKSLDRRMAEDFVGGRGFTSRIQYSEAHPGTNPLDPENVLTFATGPLTGTIAPGGNRFTVGGKSPLTGILGDSAAGGHWGPELKRAGFDMILFRGKARRPVYLRIDGEHVEIEDAQELWGKDTFETETLLKEKLGRQNKVLSIGQAGENLVRFASIISDYGHANGRTGMGALMGSKNLKSVAVKGYSPVPIYSKRRMKEVSGEILDLLKADRLCTDLVPNLGTTMWLRTVNEAGGLTTRNYQTGVFKGANKICGERLVREYRVKDKSCFSCPLECGKVVAVPSGEFASLPSKIEFLTLASLGSKCDNENLESIIKANELCNRLGLDTAEIGSIIAFLMECHEKELIGPEDCDGFDLQWGNGQTMVELIKRTALRIGIGDTLAMGMKGICERIGRGTDKYAFHVKGLSTEAMDPRVWKTYDLRWRTSSRGADAVRGQGLAGLGTPIHSNLICLPPSGNRELPITEGVRAVIWNEYASALTDLLGVCKFVYCAFSSSWSIQQEKIDKLTDLLWAATGMRISSEGMWRLTERLHNIERSFNAREGMRKVDDNMPWRFKDEPMPEGPSRGNFYTDAEAIIEEYYRQRDWNVHTGVPTRESLLNSGLPDVKEDLETLGIIP
jgi:aldehyde:ferredoxin oxidoreductase